MKTLVQSFMRFFGSYALACALLIGLFLLTLFGTLASTKEGLYAAQKMYFESWYLLQPLGKLRIPLPGGIALMTMLSLNLLVGGFVRIRKSKRTAGILVVHTGIAILLLAGLVKHLTAVEGYVRLYEGEQATDFVSHNQWEVAVRELVPAPAGGLTSGTEWVVDEQAFRGIHGDETAYVSSADLPFELRLRHFVRNARVLPKGPMWSSDYPVIDGFAVMPVKPEPDEEFNAAAIFADVVPKGATHEVGGEQAILWAGENAPFVVSRAGKQFAIEIRRMRTPMPFAMRLEKFTKEDHPRTDIASVYSSHVIKIDKTTASETPVHIAMNEPLRDKGIVAFQSSWGPSNARPGTRLFSVFSVVRNPSDRWPEYSCWVIAAGMLIAFGQRLLAFLKKQSQNRQVESAQ
ncbi:MAG: cytochrome c biogenesis protein ResB [Planctomycetes bacterium]|nr:cytochrome c biogenesis protein ResB [Planctomycetota bacterium]MCB9909209.1 cytochrome c biogenesis protein ResB [Planctomycetota bacterium]MCB9913309.1 cytochrome c biogenesis protein ResB [Planctomycetota bacterium]HRV81231.1 cytochrome c biogenesis protein ResB [Planctomycetota bacterium]